MSRYEDVVPLRAVLFDAGNTLIHLDYDFLSEALTIAGHPRPPAAIRAAEYAAKEALDRHLAAAIPTSVQGLMWPDGEPERPSYFAIVLEELEVPAPAVAPLLDALASHNRDRSLWRVVEPGTPNVLATLRARGYVLGVVSNADGRVEQDLTRLGLGTHLAAVVDSHLVGVEKPARAIFDLALARLDRRPEDTLFVGDVFAVDVLGARRAGMPGVLLDPLGGYRGRVDCPVIRDLSELLALLPERPGTLGG